jgi:TonB family protein
MQHGIEAYFIERKREARRLSALALSIALTILVGLLCCEIPFIQRAIHRSDVMRFGFEGPPRYVQMVQLEAVPGLREPLIDLGQVRSVASRRGGGGQSEPKHSRQNKSDPRLNFKGEGDANQNLVARALANQGRVPIFQSTELVIEELVRPEYPEDARDRGIEGRVSVLAHVDTLGRVVEAEVMGPSGRHDMDQASWDAVMHCKFRPYRVEGEAREVYAVFRFAFRIY